MAQQMPPNPFPVQDPTPPSRPRRRSGVLTAVVTLAVILSVMVLLNASVFRISENSISVPGLSDEEKKLVVEKSGLLDSVSYFTLNENKIAQGIESDRYLNYLGMEKALPNYVTLYVRVRTNAAWVQEMGAYYYLADDGMVLERKTRDQLKKEYEEEKRKKGEKAEEGENAEIKLLEGMIAVTGLQPKELREGRIMTTKNADRMTAYLNVMEELRLQMFINEVSELNVTDLENITLVTTDHYTVRLGDMNDMRAKMGTARAVIIKLREMGKKEGTVLASIPGEAIYSPPNN